MVVDAALSDKDRVVAEALVAAPREDQPAMDASLDRFHMAVRPGEGQGADELFAGYLGFPGERLNTLLKAGRLLAAARFFRTGSKTDLATAVIGV